MENSHKRRRLEPDRIGLTPAEQVLLAWVFREKRKANEKYREMTAYWVKRNLKAFCYFKPQLITRIDTNWIMCLTIYKNKLFSGSDDHTIRVWKIDYESKSRKGIEAPGNFYRNKKGEIVEIFEEYEDEEALWRENEEV